MGTIEASPLLKGDDHMEELLRETPDSEEHWLMSESARDNKIECYRISKSKEN